MFATDFSIRNVDVAPTPLFINTFCRSNVPVAMVRFLNVPVY